MSKSEDFDLIIVLFVVQMQLGFVSVVRANLDAPAVRVQSAGVSNSTFPIIYKPHRLLDVAMGR